MKKLILAALLASATISHASNTTVSATVTDTDGQLWTFGTWSATLTLQGGPFVNQKPTVVGVIVPASLSGTMDNTGSFSAVLTDVNSLDQTGATWNFTVCPNASIAPYGLTGCATFSKAVTGASLSLTPFLNSVTAPRFPAGSQAFGYSDIEVFPPNNPGLGYFNTSTNTALTGLRLWDGHRWVSGAGAGSSYITSLTTAGTSGPSTVVSGVLNVPQYTGGAGCSPTGSTNDILVNNGSGGCAGNNGIFTFNPTTQNVTENYTASLPGYNFGNYAVGGSSGATVSDAWYSNYPTVYTQGNFSFWAMFGGRCQASGDCNFLNLNTSYSGENPDFSAEGFVPIRNQHQIAPAAFVGTVSTATSVSGGTQLQFSGYNGQSNFGNGRPVIDTFDDVQTITVTSVAGAGSGSTAYAIATVSGTPFSVSTHGTLVNLINAGTPSNNNTPVSVTATLSASSGCSAGQMITLGGPLIESAKIVSVGTSGSNQTATFNIRTSHAAGTEYWCGGWAGRWTRYPNFEINGVKLMFRVLGTPANNQIAIARQTTGGSDGGFVNAGSWTVYHGGMLIDSRDLSGGTSASAFSVVSDNDAAWTTGSSAEVTNGLYTVYADQKDTSLFNNNPYSVGQVYELAIPAGDATAGDLNTNAYDSGSMFEFINFNNPSQYNCAGCGGIWNLKPMFGMDGTWGGLARYQFAPHAPVLEFGTSTGGVTLLQLDDATSSFVWNKTAQLWTLQSPNIQFTANVEMPGLNTGTCSSGIALDSSNNVVKIGCGGGGSGTISGQVNGVIPLATGSTAIGAQSHLDDGNTTAGTITSSEPIAVNATSLPSQIPMTYDGHAPTVGSSTTATYAVNSSGQAVLADGGGSFNRPCTAVNGLCGVNPAENAVTISSGAITLSATAALNTVTFNANVTTITFANPTAANTVCVTFTHDATSTAYTVAWPSNVLGGFAPGSTASKNNVQCFVGSPSQSKWLAIGTGVVNQ